MKVTVELDEHEFMHFMEWRKSKGAPSVKQEQSSLDETPLGYLNISALSHNTLKRYGISTVGHAAACLTESFSTSLTLAANL